MALKHKIVQYFPMPKMTRLELQRQMLDRASAEDIRAERKAKNWDKARELEEQHWFELKLHEEEEDSHLTSELLSRARKLHVPIPHRYKEDNKTETEDWYEGYHTGRRYLTSVGISKLREEIRKELKARHEARSHWLSWLSALTGLLGTATGLLAVLSRLQP